jgi:hypothetical protein
VQFPALPSISDCPSSSGSGFALPLYSGRPLGPQSNTEVSAQEAKNRSEVNVATFAKKVATPPHHIQATTTCCRSVSFRRMESCSVTDVTAIGLGQTVIFANDVLDTYGQRVQAADWCDCGSDERSPVWSEVQLELTRSFWNRKFLFTSQRPVTFYRIRQEPYVRGAEPFNRNARHVGDTW